MSATYNLATVTGQMRLMTGDTNLTSPNFQDEELQLIMNVTSGMESGWQTISDSAIPQNELLLLACATVMDALASRTAGGGGGQSVTIGDYKLVGKDQVKAISDIAQRFRDAVNNLPAWGIVEENLCGFNEMVIIRNWVLRTEM
jgi:hypothetical protein